MKQASILFVIASISLVLSACIGTSKVPVIYISPDATTVYTTSDFSPKVEFPNGIPDQSAVEIRINGVDVTSDFDLWDDGGNDSAGISGQVDNGSYPNILGALREGSNTFQVTKPSKSLLYFTMNIASANVHVTEVVDSYCGNVYVNDVGNATDLADNSIADADCSGFVRYKCEIPAYQTGTDNLGNPIYASPFVSECEAAQGGPAVPAYHATNKTAGGSKYMYIRGYFESESQLDQITVQSFSIDNAGAWFQVARIDRNHGVMQDDGEISGAFGAGAANCNGEVVDLAVNEFCVVMPDRDGVRIGGTDSAGYAYKEWLRSDVPQTDARLSGGGVMALRGEVTALEEILDVLGQLVGTGDDLITGTEYLILPTDSPPGFCIGCKSMSMDLTELYLREFEMVSGFPTPGSDNGRGGTWPSGQLNLYVDLDSQSGWGVELAGAINIKCNGVTIFGIFIPNPICAVFQSVNGPYTVKLDVTTTAEVLLALDGSYELHTTTNLQNFNIKGIDLSVSGAIGGLVGFITPLIVNLIEGMVGDMLGGMVESLVNAIFNKDLPLSRLVLPSVNTDAEATKIYMTLAPQMSRFLTNVNVYDTEVAGELAFGLHATGKPRINQSIGSLYDSDPLAHSLYQVSTARDNDTLNYTDGNVGFMLHESFVNQLMMGLWESGILYIDFNAGSDPLINTFIDDANIKFASASPWTISHLANVHVDPLDLDSPMENVKGDVKLDIDDLIIHFSGDIYDPFEQKWYYDMVFFELVLELEAFAQLVAEDGAFKVVFSSNPTFELLSFHSDYGTLDSALANSLLQVVMPMLVTEIGSFEIALPKLLGITMEVGDVWIPDTANLAFTMNFYYEGPTYREFINRYSSKCLTANLGGSPSNGDNLTVESCNDSDEQKWGLDPISGYMRNLAGEEFCMAHTDGVATNENLSLWTCTIGHGFVFKNSQLLASAAPTQVATAKQGNSDVVLWENFENTNQFWDLGKEALIFHELVESLNGKCLEASTVVAGESLSINKCDNADNQQWAYERSEGLIHAKQNTNLCIDFASAGSDAVLVDCPSAAAFSWRGGVFRSTDLTTQVLSAQGFSNGDNVNVDTRVNGLKSQVWLKESKGLVFNSFVNDESGLCLSVAAGGAYDGNNVEIRTCSEGAFFFDLNDATLTKINGKTSATAGYGQLDALYNGVDDEGIASLHYFRSSGVTTDWGVGVDLGSSNNVTEIILDGNSNAAGTCCWTRLTNVVLKLYNQGALVHTSATIGSISGPSSGLNIVPIPNIVADEIRMVVPNGGPSVGSSYIISVAEMMVKVDNSSGNDSQLWAVNPFNGSIHSQLDESYCLSHQTGVPFNGRNLELASCDPTADNFKYLTENIIAQDDNDFLADINGTAAGSDVMLWTADGSKSQIWTKGRRARVYHEYIDRTTGQCAHVWGGSPVIGADIRLNTCSENAAHRWALDSYTGQVHSEMDDDYCLAYSSSATAGRQLTLELCQYSGDKAWDFVDNKLTLDGSAYVMQASYTGSYGSSGYSVGDYVKLQTEVGGDDTQLWKDEPYVWGRLRIASVEFDPGNGKDGHCLDNAGSSVAPGTNLNIWPCKPFVADNSNDDQKWAYDLVTYQWHYKAEPAVCISLASASASNGVNVQIERCVDGYAWQFIDNSLHSTIDTNYVMDALNEGNADRNADQVRLWTDGSISAPNVAEDQIWAWDSEPQ